MLTFLTDSGQLASSFLPSVCELRGEVDIFASLEVSLVLLLVFPPLLLDDEVVSRLLLLLVDTAIASSFWWRSACKQMEKDIETVERP